MFDGIATALWALGRVDVIGLIFLGSVIGLLSGVLPGLGNVQALAVALPFTFGMERLSAVFFLSAICSSATFGGSVPAILLNIPGTPANVTTLIEGHKMAQRGEANRALAISATASAMGGLVGLAFLIATIPIVRLVTLAFGPPETFMLVLIGLVTIAYAVQRNIIVGLATAGLGVLLSLVGYSFVTGVYRFPLGSKQFLWDGIQQVPFLIGVFGLSEAIRYGIEGGSIAQTGEIIRAGFKGTVQGIKDTFRYPAAFFRSSIVGIIVGVAPGVGGSVSNVVAYALAGRVSKDPEFGKGSIEGLVAAESSNNATIGGDAVPTLAFGIPGSAAMAVLLGGLTLHGVAVGPWLMKSHMDIVWVVILGLVAGTLLSCVLGLLVARWLAVVTTAPMKMVVPVIVMLVLVGSFAVRENFWDVAVTTVSGIFGYLLTRNGFSLLPLIIGFILGAEAERAFIQSLHISQGSLMIFVQHPLALALFLGALALGFYPLFQSRMQKRRTP
jgi:putative tricarboxylic transport membrane protein